MLFTFFSENYNQNINIDDYAASRGMSVSWFIRNFKNVYRFDTNAIYCGNPHQQCSDVT